MRRSTRRSAGESNIVKRSQQVLTVYTRKTEIEVTRKTMFDRTVNGNSIQVRENPFAQTVSQSSNTVGFLWHLIPANFAGFAQANNSWNIQGARAQPTFMAATIDQSR